MHPIQLHKQQAFRLDNQKAFSLVELMVATVLSILLIGGAIVLATTGTRAAGNSENLARAQENLRFVSNFLIQELRTAGAFPLVAEPAVFLDIAADGSSITVKYEATENCLGENTGSKASEPGVAENTYSLSGNQLICDGGQDPDEDGQDTEGALLEGISVMRFEAIDGPAGEPIGVIIGFQLEDDPFPNLLYEFRVAFRNPVLRAVTDLNS